MDEVVEYRDIPDFPGYRVGDDGSVWSRLKQRNRTGWRDTSRAFGEWHRLKLGRRGQYKYVSVSFCRDGTVAYRYVHRIVLEIFVGKCPAGMECLHGDGNNINNKLSNLRWGTSTENKADQVRHGTSLRGQAIGSAKLTEDDVREIRRFVARGERVTHVGRLFGVTHNQVKRIVTRECWAHIV